MSRGRCRDRAWLLAESRVLLVEFEVLVCIYQRIFFYICRRPELASLGAGWPRLVRKGDLRLTRLLAPPDDQLSAWRLYLVQIVFGVLVARLLVLDILCGTSNVLHARVGHSLLCPHHFVLARLTTLSRHYRGDLLLAWTTAIVNEPVSHEAVRLLQFIMRVIA